MSAASRSSGGPSAEATATLTPSSSAARARERVQVGGVVARVERPLEPALAEQVRDRGALVRGDRRPQLQHLPAEPRDEPFVPCAGRRRPRASPAPPPRRRRGGSGGSPTAASARCRPSRRWTAKACEPLAPRQRFGLQLEAVLADVDELVEPDDPARVGSRAAADTGDERVAAGAAGAAPPGSAQARRRRAARPRSARGPRRRRAGSPPVRARSASRASSEASPSTGLGYERWR